MTFDELAAAVRRVPPKRILVEIERILASPEGVEGLKRDISPEAVEVMLRLGLGPQMVPVSEGPIKPTPALDDEIMPPARPGRPRKMKPQAETKPDPAPQSNSKPATGSSAASRPSTRAQTLIREQLAGGRKAEADVQAAASAAEIPQRSLIAAASSLEVRVKKGLWRLPDHV